MSTTSLLAGAIPSSGQRASFEEVFLELAPFVWRALRRLGVRDADIKDVCQDVFLVVHRRFATFDERGSRSTWVYGICLRVASDYRRRSQHTREHPLEEAPERSIPAEQDSAIDRRRGLVWLDRVLDTLDDDKRAVFVLYEIEQVPMADIAAAAGCALPTAYARLHAARKIVEAAARREQAKRSSR